MGRLKKLLSVFRSKKKNAKRKAKPLLTRYGRQVLRRTSVHALRATLDALGFKAARRY